MPNNSYIVDACQESAWNNNKQKEYVNQEIAKQSRSDMFKHKFIDTFIEVMEKYDESNSEDAR